MLKLKKPNFENTNWESAIEEASELDKELLICLARAANLLDDIDEEMSPKNLAWMIIWTNIYKTLNGARSAILRNSEFSLQLLERSCMEVELIVAAILSPFQESNSDSYQAARERLVAYAAWCLWSDISIHNRVLERRNMDKIWDDSIRYEIAENPNELEKYEKLFGKLEIEDPKELKKRRKEHEEQVWNSLEQLKNIANHREIKPWINKLETKADNRKWIRSFFELVSEDEISIMDRLKKMDVAFGYSTYQEKSSVLHASTFDNLFLFNDEKIFPKIMSSSNEMSSSIEFISSTCNSVIVRLALINRDL